jgi:hypothetical protein
MTLLTLAGGLVLAVVGLFVLHFLVMGLFFLICCCLGKYADRY